MSKPNKPITITCHPGLAPGSPGRSAERDTGSKAWMTVGFLGLLLTSVTFLLILSSQLNAQSASQEKDSLVVSFISIGAGTDYKAKEKLDLFVNDFQTKQQVQLDVTIKHWGREGETDYTYNLSKLSRKQCRAFIEEIETLFAKNNLVKISRSPVD